MNTAMRIRTSTPLRALVALTLLLACGPLCSDAQSPTCIDTARLAVCYAHVVQTEAPDGTSARDTTFSILEVGDNIAKYADYVSYRQAAAEGRGYVPEGFAPLFFDDDVRTCEYLQVYQNHPETGMCTTREYLFPSWYLYEEAEQPAWEMRQDTATIKGYRCRKLHTAFHGRDWTAWYAEDVPAPYGPWKLCNAPGLILEAASDDGAHRFVCYAIFGIPTQQPVCLDHDAEADQNIKGAKFIEKRNQLKADSRWMASMFYYAEDAIKNVTVMKSPQTEKPRLYVNGVYCAETRNKYQPLELE